MNLLEVIRTYHDGLFPPIRAQRTRQDIEASAETDARWLSFAAWIETLQPHSHLNNPSPVYGRDAKYWPPAIAEALEPLVGLEETWDTLLDNMVRWDYLSNPVTPKKYNFDWAECEDVRQGVVLQNIFKEQVLLEDGFTWDLPDATTKLIPKEWVVEVLRNDPLDKEQYVSETHDCDNFQLRLAARWAEPDLSPGCFGVANVAHRLVETGEFIEAHAINWFCDTNRNVWFVEPQSDHIYTPDTILSGLKGDYQQHVYRMSIV